MHLMFTNVNSIFTAFQQINICYDTACPKIIALTGVLLKKNDRTLILKRPVCNVYDVMIFDSRVTLLLS